MATELPLFESPAPPKKWTSGELYQRIASTFPEPGYVTLEEVRDATGFDGCRTADAIAISLYRSRGKSLWGFEIKVSRYDWLQELKQPQKAENIMRYCHHWALVASSEDIVQKGELPPTWGMYIPHKNRLKCIVAPPKLEPVPMDMRMFTALVYAVKRSHRSIDERALKEATDKAFESGQNSASHFAQNYKDLQEKVSAFEKASGLTIQYGWNGKPDKVGAAVKMIIDHDKTLDALMRQMKYASDSAERLKKEIDEQIEAMRKALAFPEPGVADEA